MSCRSWLYLWRKLIWSVLRPRNVMKHQHIVALLPTDRIVCDAVPNLEAAESGLRSGGRGGDLVTG